MNTIISIFFIDWIVDYINTPKYELTAGQESLFYIALLIICAVIFAIVDIALIIYNKIKR